MSEERVDPVDAISLEPSFKMGTPTTYVHKERKAVVGWPGLISLAGHRGYFPGCRAIEFRDREEPAGLTPEDLENLQKQAQAEGHQLDLLAAADQMNLYFHYRGNLSVVDFRITDYGIMCLITTQLDARELEDFQEASRIMDNEMQRIRKERKEKEEITDKEKAEKERADKELMILGRKAKEFNLLEKLRELDDENLSLKRELKLLKRKEK